MNEQAPHNRSYTLTDIEQYLQGSLSPAEMHAIEKAALQDPLLADAIEGYRGSSMHIARTHLQNIQQQLLQQKNRQATVIKGGFVAKRWWRAAAVIIALAGIGGTGWYLMHSSAVKQEIAVAPVTAKKGVAAAPVATDTTTQPVEPALAQTSPADRKRLPTHNQNTVAQPPVANASASTTLSSAKTEPPVTALADIQSDKAMKHAFVPLAAAPGKAVAAAAGQQQPMMLRGRATKDVDSSKSELSEVVIVGAARQAPKEAAGHATQRSTAPVDSLNLSPDGGWNHFNEYFAGKLGADTHGEVVSDLVLDETGKIKDVIIIRAFDRNLDSFGRVMTRKIKQALLDGPVWLAGNVKKPGTFRLNLEF
ncbi:hypothetical protein SAMN05444410_108121 [Hydrobacter penzbergensis]|uniref:TonB C-terminal domain-containing protein n=1 Tax=Hydrobacter penzbergensis TaxID=1235997 RepID=A0A8X8LDZ5_9BACT|nr:hypothetical protein [Hydrobacter penzbergensis]SDX04273.1 hypothetical protein SAMN05444410_108121 [Hydrobacter penzbergensis]